MSNSSDPTKKLQGLFISKVVLSKLKAYAVETEQSFEKVIEPEFTAFEQALIKKCEQVDEIRMKALEAASRAREEQRIASQHPMPVSGHLEDPIGKKILEEPITT